MTIQGRNMQRFPSGEVRIFERDAESGWRLVSHDVPPGIDYGADLLGAEISEMPAPKGVNHA